MSIEGPITKTISLQSKILQGLEKKVYLALQRYANVHRGAGQHAKISTRLYDRARDVVLDYLGLDGKDYRAIFGTRRILSSLNRSISFQSVWDTARRTLRQPVVTLRKISLEVENMWAEFFQAPLDEYEVWCVRVTRCTRPSEPAR